MNQFERETKQISITDHIVKQLAQSTQLEQKDLILKLVGMLDDMHLIAMDFAYEMTPNQQRGTANQ